MSAASTPKSRSDLLASTAAGAGIKLRTAAEEQADYEKHETVRAGHAAELDALENDAQAAAEAGEEAYETHSRKVDRIRRLRDRAAQLAAGAAKRRDEALEREAEQALIATWRKSDLELEQCVREIEECYATILPKVLALHVRAKRLQDHRDDLALPPGWQPQPSLDQKLGRGRAAIPERVEIVEVERRVPPEGQKNALGARDYETWPLVTVKEERVIPHQPPVWAVPLWEAFQAAGIKADDPDFVVPGVRIYPLR